MLVGVGALCGEARRFLEGSTCYVFCCVMLMCECTWLCHCAQVMQLVDTARNALSRLEKAGIERLQEEDVAPLTKVLNA